MAIVLFDLQLASAGSDRQQQRNKRLTKISRGKSCHPATEAFALRRPIPRPLQSEP